jgi:cyclopropane fatty-acyl-phospholipid synthase-like methyltransferase
VGDAWYERFFEGEWADIQRARYTDASADAVAAGVAALLGLKPGDALLDVPCGTGRIATPLARRGLDVTGVDFNAASLAEARAAAAAAGVALELRESDMRDLPWTERFDAALNWWGSFGYFGDEGDEAFARAVCRTLKPGGRFLVEGVPAELLFARFKDRSWSEMGGLRILEHRQYDFLTGVLHDDWTLQRPEGETTKRSSIRTYSIVELTGLLRSAGFSTFAPYATLDGRPYELGARLHLVATK